MLNRLSQQTHIRNNGAFCPFCRAANPQGHFVETGDGYARQEMSCTAEGCGKTWTDIYRLTGYTEST